MSLYADIKFKMKDGYKTPILSAPQCGQFRDVALEIVKHYNQKHGNKKQSQTITLSGEELAEYAKLYAEEVKYESINFFIKDNEYDWSDLKEVLVCDYYENGQFSIEDKDITAYNCDDAEGFMPLYNRYEEWAYQDIRGGEVDIENNIPIFKRYVQLTLEGKLFFGVQISKIESVTLEVC